MAIIVCLTRVEEGAGRWLKYWYWYWCRHVWAGVGGLYICVVVQKRVSRFPERFLYSHTLEPLLHRNRYIGRISIFDSKNTIARFTRSKTR